MSKIRSYSEADIQACLRSYDIGIVSRISMLADGVENYIYLIATDTHKYVLRLFNMDAKGKSPAAAEFEVQAMQQCRDSGVKVPKIYKTINHQIVGQSGVVFFSLMSFIEGSSLYKR